MSCQVIGMKGKEMALKCILWYDLKTFNLKPCRHCPQQVKEVYIFTLLNDIISWKVALRFMNSNTTSVCNNSFIVYLKLILYDRKSILENGQNLTFK